MRRFLLLRWSMLLRRSVNRLARLGSVLRVLGVRWALMGHLLRRAGAPCCWLRSGAHGSGRLLLGLRGWNGGLLTGLHLCLGRRIGLLLQHRRGRCKRLGILHPWSWLCG